MKNATIIGLGWLGLPLAKTLQQNGWQVKGTKRTVSDCGLECLPFELSTFDEKTLSNLLDCNALIITIPPSRDTLEHYISGIKRLVSTAILHNVQHIIYTSSTALLPTKSGVFDEQSETDKTNPLAELEAWLLTQPIHIDLLRLAGLVGRKRHPVYYLAGKQDISGANQPVNLVHLEDCIQAIRLLLERPNGQRCFHLVAPIHPTRQAFYTDIAKQYGLPDLHFSADNEPLDRIISGEKICRELGFEYRYPDPYQFKMAD